MRIGTEDANKNSEMGSFKSRLLSNESASMPFFCLSFFATRLSRERPTRSLIVNPDRSLMTATQEQCPPAQPQSRRELMAREEILMVGILKALLKRHALLQPRQTEVVQKGAQQRRAQPTRIRPAWIRPAPFRQHGSPIRFRVAWPDQVLLPRIREDARVQVVETARVSGEVVKPSTARHPSSRSAGPRPVPTCEPLARTLRSAKPDGHPNRFAARGLSPELPYPKSDRFLYTPHLS